MGNELQCNVRFGKRSSNGKALLETSELVFRGDFRLKIPFRSMRSVKAADGELRVQTAEGAAVFALGDAAEKWCEKILHPKTRTEKLGVKPGTKISLIGEFDAKFLAELKALGKGIAKAAAKAADSDTAETIFLAVNSREELSRLAKLAKGMQGAAALWIVYPKGQKTVTENDVLGGGRKVGLKDVKVVGFSATHTALKFVIPLANR
ncbi:MAG TPA: hypothetical protein VE077_18675 [Candidatus Methylomirabilis sp.]|nr:hypothetical protein [Candidatus Methylomirabilis sp.]